jgi:hypothetical protein
MSIIKNTEIKDFRTFLNEGKIGKFLKKAKSGLSSFIKKIISSLGFGQTKKIQLSSMNEKVTSGMQAQLGYYSEYVTAQEIIRSLMSDNLSVSLNGSKSNPKSAIDKKVSEYRNTILTIDPKLEDEVARMEQQGYQMGQSIYSDAIISSDDLILIHFNVILTGDSLKGKNKADVVVEITKQDTKEVIDNIMASLKAYKGWKINLANNTLTSFFTNLGVKLDSKSAEKLNHLQSVRARLWRFYVNDDFKGLKKSYGSKVASAVKPMFKTKYEKGTEPTAQHKKFIKAGHDVIQKDISNYFVGLLKNEYKKNKLGINKNILSLLGFDGTDDFYLAVKQRNKISVLSNRTSPMYKKLIEQIQSDFELVIRYKEKSPSIIYIDFYDVNKNKILNSEISVGQTASVGQSRTNWKVDFSQFKADAR